MDNIIMENNQLKQVASDGITNDENRTSQIANTNRRESTADIDVSAIALIYSKSKRKMVITFTLSPNRMNFR